MLLFSFVAYVTLCICIDIYTFGRYNSDIRRNSIVNDLHDITRIRIIIHIKR